jgi:hypothetical protein
VSCSPALKWFVALLLPLTLAWKVSVVHDDPNELASEIIQFLSHQAFDAVLTGGMVDSMPVVQATSGSCRILIAKVEPDGSSQDLVRNLATATDHVFIVFRGRIYTQQPVLLTVTDTLWSRSLRKLGLMRRIAPVLAAVASASCDIEQLPWGTSFT